MTLRRSKCRTMVWRMVWLVLLTLASGKEEEELTCPDRQAQLATRVIQCYNRAQTQSSMPFPPFPPSPPGIRAPPTTQGPRAPPPPPAQATEADLQACFAAAGQEIKILTALVPTPAKSFVTSTLDGFAKDSGLAFSVTFKPMDELTPELKFSALANITTVNNVFVSSNEIVAELNSLGTFLDLAPFIADDSQSRYKAVWQEIHPFVRQNYAIADGKIIAVPYAANLPYMTWRTDIFRRYNLTKPDTWEEVIEVARFLNRTNWNPKVANKIPVCFPKPLISNMSQLTSSYYMLTSILGSLVQYQGKAQGLLFDPLSMQPLVNSSAMARALEIYADLADLMPDASPDGGKYDANYQPIMSGGYCALGFRWAEQFKFTAYSAHLKGNVGMSLMPGSTRVWDRVRDAMVDCTASLCRGSDAIVRPDPVTGGNVTLFVNRLSYSAHNVYSASINAYSSRGYQEASYQVVAYTGLAMHGGNDNILYSPLLPFGPIKTKQISLDPEAIAAWPAVYNKTDVKAFLSATIDVVAHPNTMTDLKMPSQAQIKVVMDDASRLVERDGKAAIPAIMDQTSRKLTDIVNLYEPGGAAFFKSVYWQGIGFAPPPPPPSPAPSQEQLPPVPPTSGETTSSRDAVGIAVGMSTSVGVAAIVAAVVALHFRRRGKHRTLLGKVVAPGVGPLTTLVVTDIQSSTSLWDTIPQDMETSVALHFAVLRHVAHVHGGYESATEGDSIILGFHNPLSAVRAAMQAQADLLAVDWPAGLLSHPLCAPQYAVPAAGIDNILCTSGKLDAVRRTLPPFPLWNDAGAQSAAQRLAVDGEAQPGLKSSWYASCLNPVRAILPSSWRPRQPVSPSFSATAVKSTIFSGKSSFWPQASGSPKPVTSAIAERLERLDRVSASSVAEFLLSLVALSDEADTDDGSVPLVLYQGLRVRIGVHTGLTDESSVIKNRQTERLQYAGKPLAMANAVSAAGHGGMVLLSESTFSQLDGASLATKGLLLASMGLTQLLEVDDPVEIYQALSPQLAYRVCFNTQLRQSQQLTSSFLDAPYGRMAVCFINVVGLASLNAWSTSITQESIQVYQGVAAAELTKYGGYLVNSSAGLFLAAFKDPAHAIRWALCTLQQCLEADWDPALLEHELGEEMIVGNNALAESTAAPSDLDMPTMNQVLTGMLGVRGQQDQTEPRTSGSATQHFARQLSDVNSSRLSSASKKTGRMKVITKRTVLLRGLRLKCGVDAGLATATIEPSTGRVMHFGRMMNRCARVCAMTKTGQVWCTEEVWHLATPTINSHEARSLDTDFWQDKAPDVKLATSTLRGASRRSSLLELAAHNKQAPLASSPFRNPLAAQTGLIRTGSSNDARSAFPLLPTGMPLRQSSRLGSCDGRAPIPMLTGVSSNLPDAEATHSTTNSTPLPLPLLFGNDGPETRQESSGTIFEMAVGIGNVQQDRVDAATPIPMGATLNGARNASDSGGGRSQMTGVSENVGPDQVTKGRSRLHSTAPCDQPQRQGTGELTQRSSLAPTVSVSAPSLVSEARSSYKPAPLLVAGVPLGQYKLRGIQESVGLVQCRFDDHSVVQVNTNNRPRRTRAALTRSSLASYRTSRPVPGHAQAMTALHESPASHLNGDGELGPAPPAKRLTLSGIEVAVERTSANPPQRLTFSTIVIGTERTSARRPWTVAAALTNEINDPPHNRPSQNGAIRLISPNADEITEGDDRSHIDAHISDALDWPHEDQGADYDDEPDRPSYALIPM